MPGTLSLRQIVHFMQRCFAWEYGNRSGQNLQSKSLRRRHFVALETVLTQAADTPFVPPAFQRKLAQTFATHQRSSNCLYGAFVVCAPASQSGFGQRLCAPLFLGEMEMDDAGETGATTATRPTMLVNRSLLNTLFDDDIATSLARDLQALADRAAWGKHEVTQLVALMHNASPSMTTIGMGRFPLTLGETQVDEIARAPNTVTLVNAAAVYVTRRSRQSMGILHELGQMSDVDQFFKATASTCRRVH